jgi:integrase
LCTSDNFFKGAVHKWPSQTAQSKTPSPKKTTYTISDERGLSLEVSPKGGKWWRFRYRFEGKPKKHSLGVYPDVSLKKARERRDEARTMVADGVDPGEVKKAQKAALGERAANSFEIIAREWVVKFSAKWGKAHRAKTIKRLEKDVFPWLGATPIAKVTAPDLLKTVQRIESRGANELARRALQDCGRIFRYAIATGRADRNPAADLKGAVPPAKEKHYASITDPKGVGALMRAIDDYEGSILTQCALKLAALTFVRPGELRQAEWAEIDLDGKEWRIPANRMKMKVMHIVPLSRQAIEVLKELHPLTGRGRYLLPSERSNGRPMSENTVNASLRRMGYSKEEMTGHGFRPMASTILNEKQWNRDAIERQLAHAERDNVRAAYNYAEFLPKRNEMMQWWGDHLDALREGAQVRPPTN